MPHGTSLAEHDEKSEGITPKDIISILGFDAKLSTRSQSFLSYISPLATLKLVSKAFKMRIDEYNKLLHHRFYGNFWEKEQELLQKHKEEMEKLLASRSQAGRRTHVECTPEQCHEMKIIDNELEKKTRAKRDELEVEIVMLDDQRELARFCRSDKHHIRMLETFLANLDKEINEQPWWKRCIIFMNDNELNYSPSGQKRILFLDTETLSGSIIFFSITLSQAIPYSYFMVNLLIAITSTPLIVSLSVTAQSAFVVFGLISIVLLVAAFSMACTFLLMDLMTRVKINAFNREDRSTRFDYCPFRSFSPARVTEYNALKNAEESLETSGLFKNLPLTQTDGQTSTLKRVYAAAKQSVTFFKAEEAKNGTVLATKNYTLGLGH